ncbi:MAG: hypothetical protein V1874_02045 [Spirochaetota bacterium]
MISRLGQPNDDLVINQMNNVLKNINDTQSSLNEKMIKVSVSEQQSGLGGVVDEYA